MRKSHILLTLAIVGSLLLFSRVLGQTPEEFSERRKALRELLSRRGIAVFKAAEPVSSFYGADYRQESNFYYLTGFSKPNAALILSRRGLLIPGQTKLVKEVLLVQNQFLPSRITGEKGLIRERGVNDLLFEAVVLIERYYDLFATALTRADTLYFKSKKVRLDEPLTKELELIDAAQRRMYSVHIADPSPLLGKMRVIKSSSELKLLRKAIDITCDAQIEAIKSAEAGMYEYELAALAEYIFKRQGAERIGFRCIVGSGPNSCIIHYDANTRQMKPNELVVLDIGAEYHRYTADVTRTLPVSGTFSDRQRTIYELVLKGQQAAIDIIKPGVEFREIHQKAAEVIGKGLTELGLINNPSEYQKYFIHGSSHYIGLDVHDAGPRGILEPGMILTVEPGIYIPEEKLGVRIEDDVLVTETGHEVISVKAPKAINEIETLTKGTGIGNIR